LLNRWFLSFVDDLPAALLAALLVCFPDRHLPHRAAGSIAGFFLSSTPCPPRRSLHLTFLSLANGLPAAPLAASHVPFTHSTTIPPRRSLHRLISSLDDVWPSALLAASLVSFTHRRLARRAATPHHLFLSLADFLPAAPLAASLVSFACHCLDRRTGRRIAHASLSLAAPVSASLISLSRPPHRSPDRSFLFVARCAARWIARFLLLSITTPPRRSWHRWFNSLVDGFPTV